MCLIAPNALWALDFQFDHTIDGRQVKMLNIIDEFTREAFAIRVDHSITADDVVVTLDRLVSDEADPRRLSGLTFNGPEFVANAVAEWCTQAGGQRHLHRPGLTMAERLD